MCVWLLLAGSLPSLWARAHLPYSWLCSMQLNHCVDIAGIDRPPTLAIQIHDTEFVAWNIPGPDWGGLHVHSAAKLAV